MGVRLAPIQVVAKLLPSMALSVVMLSLSPTSSHLVQPRVLPSQDSSSSNAAAQVAHDVSLDDVALLLSASAAEAATPAASAPASATTDPNAIYRSLVGLMLVWSLIDLARSLAAQLRGAPKSTPTNKAQLTPTSHTDKDTTRQHGAACAGAGGRVQDWLGEQAVCATGAHAPHTTAAQRAQEGAATTQRRRRSGELSAPQHPTTPQHGMSGHQHTSHTLLSDMASDMLHQRALTADNPASPTSAFGHSLTLCHSVRLGHSCLSCFMLLPLRIIMTIHIHAHHTLYCVCV